MISRTVKLKADFIYIIVDDRCMGASMEDANTLLPPNLSFKDKNGGSKVPGKQKD